VIPEKKEIQAFAKQQGISGDYSDVLNNDKVSNPAILGLVPTYTQIPTCQDNCQTQVSNSLSTSKMPATVELRNPFHMLSSPTYRMMLT